MCRICLSVHVSNIKCRALPLATRHSSPDAGKGSTHFLNVKTVQWQLCANKPCVSSNWSWFKANARKRRKINADILNIFNKAESRTSKHLLIRRNPCLNKKSLRQNLVDWILWRQVMSKTKLTTSSWHYPSIANAKLTAVVRPVLLLL